MKRIIILAALLLTPLTGFTADDKPDITHWKEDFSDEIELKKNWSKYDSLLPGGDKTQCFWQIEDGALRGNAFGKVHPVGIMRKVSGSDLRLKCRIKFGEGAGIYVTFSGPNNGSNSVDPALGIHFRRTGLHLNSTQLVFADDHYVYPEAGTLYTKGMDLSKGHMTAVKMSLTANVWHDLVVEIRGKEVTARIDDGEVLTYQTHSGDEPKTSVSFSVANESKTESAAGWYDDMTIEPIEEIKK